MSTREEKALALADQALDNLLAARGALAAAKLCIETANWALGQIRPTGNEEFDEPIKVAAAEITDRDMAKIDQVMNVIDDGNSTGAVPLLYDALP